MSMIGSFRTGTTSVLTGQGSTPTAAGVCAPFPGLFLTDGASFKTGTESVLTASEPPPCGGDCSPGQVLWDFFDPAEYYISTDERPFSDDVHEAIGCPPLPGCSNFRVTVGLDCKWAYGATPFPNSLFAYLNTSGLDLASREFLYAPPPAPPGTGSPTATLAGGDGTGIYVSQTLTSQISGFTEPYQDFAGPRDSASVYFWVPIVFPGPSSGAYYIKNLRIQIVTV